MRKETRFFEKIGFLEFGFLMNNYQDTLSQLHKNLNTLREREAKYGGNAPLDLLNQINDHTTAIELTRQAIAGELMALFDRIWQDEALRELIQAPLMLNIITLTYAYPQAPALPHDEVDNLREQIFEAYSERMFNRLGRRDVRLRNVLYFKYIQ